MSNTNDTPATKLPPMQNGHGASNGTSNSETRADASKEAPPSSKKKKKKKGRSNGPKPTSVPIESTAAASAASNQVPAEGDATEEVVAMPTEKLPNAPIDEVIAAPIKEPPIEAPAESLRLRMKVWTNPATAKRYLMPSAFMRDIVNGQPVSDVMYAYAMRDDDTKLVTLTVHEWNALPFSYFQEDGDAPRATTRPVDVIYTHEGMP